MPQVGKLSDGTLVEIVRVSDKVRFSSGSHVLVCFDWQKPEFKKQEFKWLPIATRFVWVRSFLDA